MNGYRTILFPVSLTPISPGVAQHVALMAKKFEAEVHLLHVLRRFDWFVDTYVSQPSETDFKRIATDFESEVMVQAKKKLNAFAQKHLEGIRIAKTSVVSGIHYKEVLAYVDAEPIDLIIMGAGNTLQKTVFGSVTEKVLKLAPVPVLLIKNNPNKGGL